MTTIKGTKGKDYLVGGNDGDTIKGGKGADVLDGRDGADWLKGGKGRDIFVFDAAFTDVDTIADFQPDRDRIVTDLDPNVDWTFGGLRAGSIGYNSVQEITFYFSDPDGIVAPPPPEVRTIAVFANGPVDYTSLDLIVV